MRHSGRFGRFRARLRNAGASALLVLGLVASAAAVPRSVLKHEQDIDGTVRALGLDPAPIGMTFVSHVAYKNPCSDIWGYVGPDGREYALVGVETGTSIVEIHPDGHVAERVFVGGVASLWRDLKTLGHYLYVVSDQGDGGMQIIDLSGLPNVATVAATFREFGSAHNFYIDTDRALAFVCGTRIARGGLRIYDLSDRLAPVLLGTWNTHYTHDVHVRGNLAYLFNGQVGVDILDVSDPAKPVRRQLITYTGLSYAHSGWVSEDGSLLAVNDEFDEIIAGVQKTRLLFFLRDPVTGQYERTYTYSGPNRAVDHNTFFLGDYAVMSNYTFGVVLVHIAELANVHLHGKYDTHPESDNTEFAGAWGVYPYLPSRRIIVSDINRGLVVLQIDEDLDGVRDSAETETGVFVDMNDTGTDPHRADTDGDGLLDGEEVALNSDPNLADTDADGINDRDEQTFGLDPLVADPFVEVPAAGSATTTALACVVAGAALFLLLERRTPRPSP